MIKTLFNKKDILTLTFIALIIGVLVTCIEVMPGSDLTLENAYILAKDGYKDMENREYHATLVNAILNVMIFIPLISQYFISDYDVAKSYIFCRLSDNSRWLKYKIFQSAVYCFYAAVIYNLILLAMVTLMGFELQSGALLLKYFVLEVLAHFLILFMIVLANNVACLKFKPNTSTLVTMIVSVALVVVLCFLKGNEVQYHILSHYFVSLHLEMGGNPEFFSFPSWVYYGGVLFIVIAELVAGNLIIKKEDMI